MSNNKEKLKPETQRKIDALCSFREDDFTKSILLPLFQAMNYHRVEFNGGPNERGRDLIAQKANPPLPTPKTVYVQAKKIKSPDKAAGGVEFDKLVFQVRQCLKQPVTDIYGREYQADEVFIISPNQVSTRFIDEVKSMFFSEENKNIHLIDGVSVLGLIDQYKPELMDVLINIEDKIVSKSGFAPGNAELLQAIKQGGKKSIEKLYNDLSFFVGSIDSNLLMHFDINVSSRIVEVEEGRWEDVKSSLDYIIRHHGIFINKRSFSEIESEFEERLDAFNSDENQSLIIEKEKLMTRVGDLRLRSEALSSDLLARAQALKASNKISDDEEEVIKKCAREFSDCDLGSLGDLHVDLLRDLNSLKKISNDIERSDSFLSEIIPKLKERPKYLVEANYDGVKKNLRSKVDKYFYSIDKINKGRISKIDLKKFLVETEETLTLVDYLVHSRIAKEFFEFSFSRDKQDRVAISAHDIFETGHDIAVYGSAGVGKTTTLEMYSNICEEAGKDIVYVPLNRTVDRLSKIKEKNYDENRNGMSVFIKDLLIKAILVSRKIDPDDDKVSDAKRYFAKGPTVVLDGLDEAFSAISEIIVAIKNYKAEFPNSQIIISSRDCVSYLDEIDFFGITLLPFTKAQLTDFINSWFESDKEKGQSLVERVARDDAPDALKTPLLATIVCSLVEKGVKAPSTESEVYSERLRLLLGDYDSYKGISRQENTSTRLFQIASLLSLAMHEKRVRSLPMPLMVKYVLDKVRGRFDKKLVESCLSELVDPCCVLVLDPISGEYSFGHFRFQEHLVAQAIRADRGISVAEITAIDWWRGALCIYAQDGNVANIVEDVYKINGNIKKSLITLREMASNVPVSERESVREIINMYSQQDDIENLLLEEYAPGHALDDFEDIWG